MRGCLVCDYNNSKSKVPSSTTTLNVSTRIASQCLDDTVRPINTTPSSTICEMMTSQKACSTSLIRTVKNSKSLPLLRRQGERARSRRREPHSPTLMQWLIFIVCSPNPCWNGGTCIPMSNNLDYTCVCPSNIPLTGKHCDQLLATTTSGEFHLSPFSSLFESSIPIMIAWSPCSSNPCMNSGVCSVNAISNTFTCTCSIYYYGNRCECK